MFFLCNLQSICGFLNLLIKVLFMLHLLKYFPVKLLHYTVYRHYCNHPLYVFIHDECVVICCSNYVLAIIAYIFDRVLISSQASYVCTRDTLSFFT